MKRVRSVGLCVSVLVWLLSLSTTNASASTYGAAAFGGNTSGQLGNGTTHESSFPVIVLGATELTAVAAGGEHSLALRENGEVIAWGENSDGQVGDGTTTTRTSPVAVKGLPKGEKVIAIATGADFSLALEESGHVWAWGSDARGELGNGSSGGRSDEAVEVSKISTATAIAAGAQNGYALLANKTVVSWGDNEFDQLGDGSSGGLSDEPVSVEGLEGVVRIAAGGEHALALLENGTVKSWGRNLVGELGDGTTTNRDRPVSVSELTEVKQIAAGTNFSMALLNADTVKTWGNATGGELGDGSFGPEKCGPFGCSKTPVEVKELTGVKTIGAGNNNGYAIKTTERLWGWGGSQALGSGVSGDQNVPVEVTGLGEVQGVAGGLGFALTYGAPLPKVNRISPESGSSEGGNTVTITGERFKAPLKVKFGTVEASSPTIVSESEITVKAPLHSPASVAVTVTTSAGTSPKESADVYTYLPGSSIQIGRCKRGVGTGKYKTGTCTEVTAEGAFGWTPGFEKPGWTWKQFPETKLTLEAVGGAKLVCEAQTGGGEYLHEVQVEKVTLKLTGCTSGASTCTSAGAAAGEIVTNTLGGTLGWTEKESNKVGLGLTPATEGQPVFEAECGTSVWKVTGAVIGAITPINSMNPTFKIKFKQKKGEQSILHFQGELLEQSLEVSIAGGAPEQAGLGLETTVTNEEELEINTVI